MQQRIDALNDLRGALAALNISTNPALWEKEFLKEPNESVMASIESMDNSLSKLPLIQETYDAMVKEVYDEMYNVFGTRNDASAAAFASTYEAMLKRPENYIDIGLGLFDAAAVTAYAAPRAASSDAYGVFRLKRIAQYQAEKAAIINQ
jgi:hypothetical protein